jgi:hypothetical protein
MQPAQRNVTAAHRHAVIVHASLPGKDRSAEAVLRSAQQGRLRGRPSTGRPCYAGGCALLTCGRLAALSAFGLIAFRVSPQRALGVRVLERRIPQGSRSDPHLPAGPRPARFGSPVFPVRAFLLLKLMYPNSAASSPATSKATANGTLREEPWARA